MKEYNLTFIEAMELVLNKNKCVIGKDFSKGTYIKKGSGGEVDVFDFDRSAAVHYKRIGSLLITKGVLDQNYREVNILTENELYN